MSDLNNYDYYVARAKSARDLAAKAANPGIAIIHVELATRYESTASQIKGLSQRLKTY